ALSLSTKAMSVNGSLSALYSAPAAVERLAASLVWSNAGARLPASASTRTDSLAPPRRSLRDQKRGLLWNQGGGGWGLYPPPPPPRPPRPWGGRSPPCCRSAGARSECGD